jgi:hypothetical protein
MITTEECPAARVFQGKLVTISEKLFGKITETALVAAGSPAVIQIFGDIALEKLAFVGPTVVAGRFWGSPNLWRRYCVHWAVSRHSRHQYKMPMVLRPTAIGCARESDILQLSFGHPKIVA